MKLLSVYSAPGPIGPLEIITDSEAGALVRIRFADSPDRAAQTEYTLPKDDSLHQRVHEQFWAYFEGSLQHFDLPTRPKGTTFQQQVWYALASIPYGQTISYRDLANKLGDAGKVRAVGRANGANPLPIVLPCHRVIGADGSLTGYAGGIERKRWLLRHEGALLL